MLKYEKDARALEKLAECVDPETFQLLHRTAEVLRAVVKIEKAVAGYHPRFTSFHDSHISVQNIVAALKDARRRNRRIAG